MPEVSRETDALVGELFPGRQHQIVRLSTLLATVAVSRGLMGPREAGRIWHRHIFNCAVIGPAFSAGAEVADIGSGAGLPGLVLALSRPDLRITLIEPLERRVSFLSEAIDELRMTSVTVVRARAEELGGSLRFDSVTARAVAPLSRLAQWAQPLCRPGAELVAIKGATAYDEVANLTPRLRQQLKEEPTIEQYGVGVVSPPTTVVRLRFAGSDPSR